MRIATSKYISAVRERIDSSANVAYVYRIELQRAVLKLHRAIAADTNSRRPETLDDRLKEDGGIGSASNRVAAIAAQICQPSEALDRRWTDEWQALQGALRSLEIHLIETPVVRH
jgi:hypothetical protein